jgi:hypothetical protein
MLVCASLPEPQDAVWVGLQEVCVSLIARIAVSLRGHAWGTSNTIQLYLGHVQHSAGDLH